MLQFMSFLYLIQCLFSRMEMGHLMLNVKYIDLPILLPSSSSCLLFRLDPTLEFLVPLLPKNRLQICKIKRLCFSSNLHVTQIHACITRNYESQSTFVQVLIIHTFSFLKCICIFNSPFSLTKFDI